MISTIFAYIAYVLIKIIAGILGFVAVIAPPQIGLAIIWLTQKALLLQGIFPISDLLYAVLFLLTLVIAKWIIKLIIFTLNLIPGVKIHMPGSPTYNTPYQQVNKEQKGQRLK